MRVLEISRSGFFKALQPNETEWIRWGRPLTQNEPWQPGRLDVAALTGILRRLRRRDYDLLVLPAIHPDHGFEQSSCKLLAKHALTATAKVPASASLLHRLIGETPHIIVDIRDETVICHATRRLFPRHRAYFKRELDLDMVPGLPSPDRIRPLPLFLPDENAILPAPEKTADLFFAGAVNSRVRADALAAARSLAAQGIRVVLPEAPLPYPDYMAAMARSWLVLSPEGIGWDCYRHYEACLAFSVPVINAPGYRRTRYLEDGVHCFYYDRAGQSLPELLRAALSDKQRLLRMAEAGHRHVRANHTRAALARYMLRATLAGTPADGDAAPAREPALSAR